MSQNISTLVACTNCGTVFDLSNQFYSGDLCPSCKRDADGEESTMAVCTACNDRYERGTGVTATVSRWGMPGSERVGACSPECKEDLEDDRRRDPEPRIVTATDVAQVANRDPSNPLTELPAGTALDYAEDHRLGVTLPSGDQYRLVKAPTTTKVALWDAIPESDD